jgi:ankyrin repeat protein
MDVTDDAQFDDTMNAWGITDALVDGNMEGVWKILNSHGMGRDSLLNIPQKWGAHRMKIAAMYGFVDVVQFLIDNGVRVEIGTPYMDDISTLATACCAINFPKTSLAVPQHAATVRLLVSNGANVNNKNFRWRTPLHTAASNLAVDVAAVLVQHGADVNAQDIKGETPLFVAISSDTRVGVEAENRKLRMVEFLLRKGADASLATNVTNITPLDMAQQKGNNIRVIHLLELVEEAIVERCIAIVQTFNGRGMHQIDSGIIRGVVQNSINSDIEQIIERAQEKGDMNFYDVHNESTEL